MTPRILFTTVAGPPEKILDFAATDQMAYRLTRAQELFELYLHTHASPLHLLAQNLDGPSVVLENPPFDALGRELDRGYDVVGITFDMLYAERLLETCELIRRRSPSTRIVVGGNGTLCTDLLSQDPRWQGKVDAVCRGEGVGFMRNLLGLPPSRSIRSRLPKEGSTLPWLNPKPVGTIGIILSGLGCTERCPFCTTSAYTGGRYVELMDARQIYEAMKTYWTHAPFTNSVTIYDENFLDHADKVDALGALLRNDRELGLRRLNFAAFGSLKALSRLDPDELLMTGVDTVWVGVESKFATLSKRAGNAAEEIIPMLHSIGIKTIGSWILGQDIQRQDNIQEDMDYFAALDPCLLQLSLLTVMPGTALHRSYAARGRIPTSVPWNQYHLYGNTFTPKHFTHGQMLELIDGFYRRLYREHGASLMKILEVNLNGYAHCSASARPVLREDRAAYFKQRASSYYPLVATALEHAPSARVRARVEEVDRRYRDLFGSPTPSQRQLADVVLRKADEEMERRHQCVGARPIRSEPYRRYSYPPLEERSVGKPYAVEYPAVEDEVVPKKHSGVRSKYIQEEDTDVGQEQDRALRS